MAEINRNKIIAFLHGWPDDETLWTELIEKLSDQYQCLTFTLPGFERGRAITLGEDFPEILKHVCEALEEIKISQQAEKTILVGHDWGAFLSYLVEARHPHLIDGLVTLDVGGEVRPTSLVHGLYLVGYQWWLMVAWFIGKVLPPVGDWMAQTMAFIAGAPHPRRARSRMGYLYFYLWRGLFIKKYRTTLPRNYLPKTPILFLYGGNKRYMFHSESWLKRLKGLSGARVVELPAAGHWLTYDEPEATRAEIHNWIDSV